MTPTPPSRRNQKQRLGTHPDQPCSQAATRFSEKRCRSTAPLTPVRRTHRARKGDTWSTCNTFQSCELLRCEPLGSPAAFHTLSNRSCGLSSALDSSVTSGAEHLPFHPLQ
ncbi:hypothetical protein GN956_G22764 [Arapaima gigas]